MKLGELLITEFVAKKEWDLAADVRDALEEERKRDLLVKVKEREAVHLAQLALPMTRKSYPPISPFSSLTSRYKQE